MAEVLYDPHINQIKIHECKARNRVVVAGRRFGKTAAAINEGIYTILQVPRQIVWIILPHLKQAKEIYWVDPDVTRYFMPLVQRGIFKKNDSDLSLFCRKTNSWIRLKGADNYESLRGSGLDLLIWDEVADVKPEAFDVLKPALADSPGHRMLYIGTPKGLNHFHDFALYGDHHNVIPTFEKPLRKRADWQTFHFTSYDNKSWPEQSYERKTFVEYIDKERLEADEKGKTAFFSQEYMASFEESGGRFFPKWSYATHVITREVPELVKSEYIIGTFDWGRLAPMAWYAHAIIPVNYEGLTFNRIITFAEVYGGGKSPYEQAEDINNELKRFKADYTIIKKTYYDPSMDTKQDDGSLSVSDQLSQAFRQLNNEAIPLIQRAVNKRPPRWAALDNWMRSAPDGLPFWMITKNCKNLIRTIPLMIPDENKIEDIDTTLEDHALDSVSYGIQYIKWVNPKPGAIHYPKPTGSQMSRPPPVVNPDKFANIDFSKANRDWRHR